MKKMLNILMLVFVLAFSCIPVHAEGEDGTIHITTVAEFEEFAQQSSYDAYTRGKTIVLDNDISLQDLEINVPIFCGVFDGQGHTISGLVLRSSLSPMGLFGIVGGDGEIQNLNVSAEIAPNGEESAIGGIVGINYGRIENSSFLGSVEGSRDIGGIAGINTSSGKILNCTVSGVVYGQTMTGGIVGYNNGVIQGCTNSALVNTDADDSELTVNDLAISHSLDVRAEADESKKIVRMDVGGIAGYSSGSITECRNEGTIGYPQVGYNVGGIVGRNSGYVAGSKNIAQIYGRKDVGGIEGQAEPYVETQFSASSLATLSSQVNTLDSMISTTQAHADEADATLNSRLNQLSNYVSTAQNSLEQINVNPDVDVDINLEEIEADAESAWKQINFVDASETIVSSVSGLYAQTNLLLQDVQGKGQQVVNDAQAITSQIQAISTTLSDAISAVQNPSNLIQDTSTLNPDDVIMGKALNCTNNGEVSGTLNVGGIAGSMALEYSVDPEDDISSLPDSSTKTEYQLKCIVQKCVNNGTITSVRNNTGGIVGREDLGLVVGCESYESITSASGNNVGGIAGITASVLRDNSAKCTLSGVDQVGGIVGDGTEGTANGSSSLLDNNVSMVIIKEHGEGFGAISGGEHGEFTNNVFVSDDLAGINGVSYTGKADPISYEQLLTRSDLPTTFQSFTLKFVADGQELKSVTFNYGDSFDKTVYPSVPSKDGKFVQFDIKDLQNLHFDTTVTATYVDQLTALSSDEKRGSGRSIFYVEGTFDDESEFTSSAMVHEPESFHFVRQSFWPTIIDYLAHPGEGLAYDLLEQWTLTIPDDGNTEHEVRYLLPTHLVGSYQIYENHDGSWNRVDSEKNGSYAVFTVLGQNVEVAIITAIPGWWIYALIAGLVLVGVLVVLRVRNREKHKATREAILHRIVVNKRLKIGFICLAVFNLLVVFAGVHFVRSGAVNSVRAYQLVKEYAATDSIAMEVDISSSFGTKKSDETFLLQKGEEDITTLTKDNLTLYYHGGNIYLENGRSCQISDLVPDYGSLLEIIATIYENGTITTETEDDKTVYRLTAQQEEAQKILEVLMAQYAEDLPDVKSIDLLVYEDNGKLSKVTMQSAGVLKDDDNTAYTISAEFTPQDSTKYMLRIPEAVTTAVESNTESEYVLTQDELNLLEAWALVNYGTIESNLHVLADTNLFHLDDTILYRRTYNDGSIIRMVQKNDLVVYFNDETLCDANGNLSTSIEATSLVKTGSLLETVYDICLNGKFNVSTAGNAKVYTIEVDGDTINVLKDDLLSNISIDGLLSFNSGSIQITLNNNQISRITVSMKGQVEVLNNAIPVTLSTDASIHTDTDFTVPDKVKETLEN